MKTIYMYICALILSASLSTSCSSLLNIEETDFIGGDLALRTVKDNESLLMGAYSALGSEGVTGATGYEMGLKMNGVLSDELRHGDFYVTQSTHEWKFNYDDITIRDTYMANRTYYRVIDRVNRILGALPNAVVEEPADEVRSKNIKGEALLLRAFSHFELFRYYAGNYKDGGLVMPYMEEASLVNQARIEMEEYFTKILRDLNDSKSLLKNSLSDVYRMNLVTADALHARIALYMENWEDAIKYSTNYINAIPLATQAEFDNIWTDKSSAEISFKLKRTNASRVGSFFLGLFTKTDGKIIAPASVSWAPSEKLWNSYDQKNDVRFNAYLIDEPILEQAGKLHKILKKYSGTGYATSNENVADIKVFRTGEMYLIRAEARAEINQYTGANSAESDINILRGQRITDYKGVTFASKDVALSNIMEERFKELALEGHRFWDLKRKGLPVVRTGADIPSEDGKTLEAGNFRFVMPIPKSEMNANNLMKQNPGYNN
ncbi:RagB/SusD family nutrient uptake outer membrane protein [Sphingobacterium sp. UT-1RO-CII-1]|uniref:RagB/SusD family nutrient uptake outer membrane protein n=1 Tax=Sphingobacterium sp. UT-1RO-CII-1 TaxID=2995225 RepID=UPI00227D1B81|nr:RagB/SusD family nutrient uptake outer membrane protein [Sphingobacterium sp. UT-1RO-CII-1]MCY4780769.1 RagB/SusD family nutrient uptake outer membrane protein [Sphingobacterium sp. UT-1RO-CII-1]